MMLPLRIELAMTFKAVFPEFLAPGQIRASARSGRKGGFGLQHTDFARRCQRFAALTGGMAKGRGGPILRDFSVASVGKLTDFAPRSGGRPEIGHFRSHESLHRKS